MATVALTDMERKASLTLVPARTPVPRREFQIPSHAERAASAGHDFGRISVMPEAPRPAAKSCPLRATPSRCPFGGACHTCPTHVQRKLAIGEAGDEYEREADRVAAQVRRMPAPPAAAGSTPAAGLALAEAPPVVHEVLQSPGQPLDTATRTTMESRFGYDFGSVRVHADARAAESARAVNAVAYTVGSDVVFGEGQAGDGRLLAHELAHVVQQGGMGPGQVRAGCLQRLVVPGRVSCNAYPPGHAVITAIGTYNAAAATQGPTAMIQDADGRAIEMLDRVINELSAVPPRVRAGAAPAWPLIADVVAEALHTRLRLDPEQPHTWTGSGPGTVELPIRWYRNVRYILNSGIIRYTCLGAACGTEWAYTYPTTERREIHLCERFWRGSGDNQALTLIHEAAHLYYGLEDAGGGAGNASCLEQFVADLNNVAILPGLVGICRPPA